MDTRNVILQKIIRFNRTYSDLTTVDAAIAVPASFATYVLMFGSLSWWGGLIACAGLYLAREKFFDRPHYRNQFLAELAELKNLYLEHLNKGGDTSDETFLRLLAAISPFISDAKKLLPSDKRIVLSQEFKDILSESPHNMQFLEQQPQEKTQSLPARVFHYFYPAKNESKAEEEKKKVVHDHRKLPMLFAGPLAQIKLAMYHGDGNLNANKAAEESSSKVPSLLRGLVVK